MEDKVKKTSKPIMLIIVEILGIIAFFLIFLYANINDSVRLYNFYERPTQIEDGWYIVHEDNTREEFKNWGSTIDEEKVVLESDLSFVQGTKAIGFYNYYSIVKVYRNDTIIFQMGDLSDYEEHRLIGNTYLIIQIDEKVNPDDKLQIVFENPNGVCLFGIDYGTEKVVTQAIIWEYMSVLVMLVCGLIVFMAIFVFRVSRRTRKYVTASSWYFLIFFAFVSLWELFDSQYLQLFGVPAGVVCLLSFEIFMLIPIPLLLFGYSFCERNKLCRALNIVFGFLALLNSAYINVLNFAFDMPFENTLMSTHIIVGLTAILLFIELWASMRSANKEENNVKNKEKRLYKTTFIGYAFFFVSAVAQYISFFNNPADSNTFYLRFGTLAFGFILTYNIIKTIDDRVEEQRIIDHRKLFNEKQKVEETRMIMTEALKTIIPEKYIPDILDEYKLQHDTKKDEEVNSEEHSFLSIGHAMRYATILVSDIRGFSEISSKMNANRLGEMLNHYLATMTQIVEEHNGRVLEFIGDGILAAFGVEQDSDDGHADDAVIAGIEMQKAIEHVNKWNEKHGFPNNIGIGIGINTGYVFCGIIGSLDKFKFDVLGANVNLASRIEGYTTGGQVLVSEDTKYAIKGKAEYASSIVTTPKGFMQELTCYFVKSLDEHELKAENEMFKKLKYPIKVSCNLYEEKKSYSRQFTGVVTEVSMNSIIMETEATLNLFDTVRIEYKEGVTCKVVGMSERGVQMRFTTSAEHYDGKTIFADIPRNSDSDRMKYNAETKKFKQGQKKTYSFLDK